MNNASHGRSQVAPVGLPQVAQYVSWRLVPRANGKPDKMPCDEHGNPINHLDARNWRTLAEVWLRPWGVGFVQKRGGPIFMVDLDDCIDPATGAYSALAIETHAMFPGAYVERSVSGKGLHIIGMGALALPETHRKRRKGLKLEIYTGDRFFAIGDYIHGDASTDHAPALLSLMARHGFELEAERIEYEEGRDPRWSGPEDDAELLRVMIETKPRTAGAMFGDDVTMAQLWQFDHAALARKYPSISARPDGLPFDHSAVDAALMMHLSYFTGRDQPRMERLFRLWQGFRPHRYDGRHGARLLWRVVNLGSANPRVYGQWKTPGPQGPAPSYPTAGAAPAASWGTLAGLKTSAALDRMILPEPEFIIDEVMTTGSTLLVGKPKKGKSFMALEIAICVALGIPFMGYDCKQGDVIYLALEDNQRRMKSRTRAICEAKGVQQPANLQFGTIEDGVPTQDAGLNVTIANHFDQHPDCRLIIIDTLAKIRFRMGRGENSYDYDRRCLDPFTDILASRPGRAIIIVHHARKAEGLDPYDSASGTTGLTGAVDQMWFLATHQESGKLTLNGVGRDIEPFDFAVERVDAQWENLGDPEEAIMSDTRSKILEFLNRSSLPQTQRDIAKACDETGNVINQRLRAMLKKGLVKKTERGKYVSAATSMFGAPAP